MTERKKVSAFIVCCNEQNDIERALKSIAWCDEIVIVDSGSTDSTIEICKRFTNTVLHNPWKGHREQKQFALERCSHEWVLNIDADEEVSPELRARLISILSSPNEASSGYEISRVVHYLNRWWRRGGWYPEYRLRFMRKSKARWGGENPHEKALVEGPVSRLFEELYHYTYTDISDQIRTVNNFSSVSATVMFQKGKQTSYFEICSRPVVRFFKFYVIKRGYREGWYGLFVALIEAFSVFLKYFKLKQLHLESNARK